MPSRPIPVRRRKTPAQRYRESATWDEVPPLFETVEGTKALAMIGGGIGPVTGFLLSKARPGIGIARYMRTVRKYLDLGILVQYKIMAFQGFPIVYALNKKHLGYAKFQRLMTAIWKHQIKPKMTHIPRTPYRMPPETYHHADGAAEIYNQKSRHGEILHLLAEFNGPIEQIALAELLGRKITVFHPLVTRLTAFGLVTDRYANLHRWVQLNNDHPIVPQLRSWLRYVNQHQARRYVELREKYHETQREGGYDRTTRMRRNKAARAHSLDPKSATKG